MPRGPSHARVRGGMAAGGSPRACAFDTTENRRDRMGVTLVYCFTGSFFRNWLQTSCGGTLVYCFTGNFLRNWLQTKVVQIHLGLLFHRKFFAELVAESLFGFYFPSIFQFSVRRQAGRRRRPRRPLGVYKREPSFATSYRCPTAQGAGHQRGARGSPSRRKSFFWWL